MNRFVTSFVFCVLALVAAASTTACGGGGDPGPGPLKHHLDEAYIASIPMESKSEMLKAQNDYQTAKAEKMKAEADLGNADTELEVGRNEVKQARLDRDTARSKKKAADESGDMNRVNAEARNMRVADLQVQAAELKVSALEMRRGWLKKQVRYTEEKTYAEEADYELSKAKLCKANNIAPKNFAYQAYVDQQKERSKRVQRAKLISDQEKQKFLSKKKEWEQKRAEAAQAAGTGSATSASTGG